MGLTDRQTFRPADLAAALDYRARTGAAPYAGGTDLMPGHRRWLGLRPNLPERVMFIGHLPELTGLQADGDELVIGAARTLADLEADPLVPELFRQVIAAMAAPGVRNLATLGGNICNASPAGDTLPYLHALEARLVLSRPGGERLVPIDQFITGPGQTDLAADELLTAVRLPLTRFNRTFHHKVAARRANALSKASMVGLARLEEGDLADLRLAWGAVGPRVVRSPDWEAELRQAWQGGWSEAALDKSLADLAGLVEPIDDQRSTADYRRRVVVRLSRYFLESIVSGD